MFRNATRVLKHTPCQAMQSVFTVQKRGMATAQQLNARIKVVGNIKKITKAMKMVAAAKLRSVQNQLELVRNFQAGVTNVWPQTAAVAEPDNMAIILITSDRGLCGSINSAVAKQGRSLINEAIANKKNVSVVLIGDKGKQALERLYSRTFAFSVSESYKSKVMSFKQVAMVTDAVLEQVPADRYEFAYNRFKNLLSFETTRERNYSYGSLTSAVGTNPLAKFEVEDGGGYRDILRNLFEFRLGIRLFHLLQENATSEQSSRMNAMGNSSKNAGVMQDALKLLYNRTRQAKITTELIEIISGAVVAEDGAKKKS